MKNGKDYCKGKGESKVKICGYYRRKDERTAKETGEMTGQQRRSQLKQKEKRWQQKKRH